MFEIKLKLYIFIFWCLTHTQDNGLFSHFFKMRMIHAITYHTTYSYDMISYVSYFQFTKQIRTGFSRCFVKSMSLAGINERDIVGGSKA